MNQFVSLLNVYSLMGLIGVFVFIYSYRHSIQIFDWIEKQTYGNRNYILEKLDFLFIKVNPDHITFALLFLSFGLSIIALGMMGIMGYWSWGFFLATVLTIIGWKIPIPVIDYLVEKRIKAYQNQMIDALTLLANGIRAGLSMNQSIGMVVDEMPAPISQEFNIILQQNRVGVPLEECLENLGKRIPLEDNDMFVTSINILKETGGNLAEVFDTIVGVIRERIRLQQKIDTYTAQSMVQGIVLFAMPFFIGLVYVASDPKSVETMFTTPLGIFLTMTAIILDVVGGIVILKIARIRV